MQILNRLIQEDYIEHHAKSKSGSPSGPVVWPVLQDRKARFTYVYTDIYLESGSEHDMCKHGRSDDIRRMSGKKKSNLSLSLQESLDLLQNLPSERNDALTDGSSDEEVPENYLQKFPLDY
ncbi:hypothetical protein TNCV_321531 [Trichonephila clavipes]|nr:hypothetical protein TNCV_321531 [Trichonephila clavipes]